MFRSGLKVKPAKNTTLGFTPLACSESLVSRSELLELHSPRSERPKQPRLRQHSLRLYVGSAIAACALEGCVAA
jgi:hypothetical protein